MGRPINPKGMRMQTHLRKVYRESLEKPSKHSNIKQGYLHNRRMKSACHNILIYMVSLSTTTTMELVMKYNKVNTMN